MNKTLPTRSYRPFQFDLPTQLQFGEGLCINLPHPLVQQHQRIALITDAHLQALFRNDFGVMDIVSGLVDTQTKPDSSVRHINALGERMREAGVTLIIALGGGSVMDTAKCAAVVAQKAVPSKPTLVLNESNITMPLLCIPTTAGTVRKVPNGSDQRS